MSQIGWKKLNIYLNDATHADFKIKLKYYDISQNEFLRTMIDTIVEDNPLMIKLIMEKYDHKRSNRKASKIKKDMKEKQKIEKEFALNEEEIENIFDLIEKESDYNE